MMMKMAVYLIALITIFISGGLVYFGFIESSVIEYKNIPFPVRSPIKAGTYASVFVSVCNHSKKERILHLVRVLEHQNDKTENQLLPSLAAPILPGCIQIMRTGAYPISADTKPGMYRYKGFIFYEGLLKTHSMPWISEYFEIVP